jgi:tRNA-modifying protein YgfZ
MTARSHSLHRAFFDLSARLKLRVIGADCLRFLNGQVTNDVRKASDTAAIEACVLNAKGKMEGHLFLYKDDDAFLLDAHASLQSSLQPRLERYIIADDVQIQDVTARLSIFHVIGETPSLATAARIVSADRFGFYGHDIWLESNQFDQVRAQLAKDLDFCDDNCAENFRMEQGIPLWGRELTNDIIPVEANLERRCINYEKGCYIGQETISRMKMSGQRNKELRGLISVNGIPLAPGARLLRGGRHAGWVTSATRVTEREIALGYVKRGFNSIGTKLEAVTAEHPPVAVEVIDLPFRLIGDQT